MTDMVAPRGRQSRGHHPEHPGVQRPGTCGATPHYYAIVEGGNGAKALAGEALISQGFSTWGLRAIFVTRTIDLSFAQILSEFGGWRRQSPTACEQTARCGGYCQQKAVMAAVFMVVTGQYVTCHSALPSTQPVALSTCSSVSAINTTCSGHDALELASNLRER